MRRGGHAKRVKVTTQDNWKKLASYMEATPHTRRVIGLLGAVLSFVVVVVGAGCSGDLLRYRTKMWKKCQGDLLAQKERYERFQEKHEGALAEARKKRVQLEKRIAGLKGDVQSRDARVAALKREIAANAEKIVELNKQKEQMRKRSELFKKLALKLREMIEAGNLKVEIRKGRMIVKMSDKVLFDPGRARLKKDAREPLRKLAAVLKEIADRDFVVAGHTDNQRLKSGGRFKSNWELSTARAVQVVKFLQKEGVSGKRLSASGYAQFDPLGNNETDEGRALNRRIEIVVMPKISELPPIQRSSGGDTKSGGDTDTRPTPRRDTRPTPRRDTRPTPRRDTPPTPRRDTPPTPRRDTPPTPRRDTPPTPRQDTRPTPRT